MCIRDSGKRAQFRCVATGPLRPDRLVAWFVPKGRLGGGCSLRNLDPWWYWGKLRYALWTKRDELRRCVAGLIQTVDAPVIRFFKLEVRSLNTCSFSSCILLPNVCLS